MMKIRLLTALLFLSQLNTGYAQEGFEQFNAQPEGPSQFDQVIDSESPSIPDDGDISIDTSVDYDSYMGNEDYSGGSNPNLNNGQSRLSDPNEKKVFGRTAAPAAEKKKESPYVSLNPETAFGPEIVESFDFPNADLLEVTKHMQKLTGINLILDKDIKGKVSISAPTAITVGDAWKAYLAALNMAGYALVKSGAFYKIIRSSDLRYTPTSIYTGDYIPDTENYMMKIIALKNVDASEIERNFRPFMTRFGRIIAIKQTNTIIITDTGTNINRLLKLVQFLDVPGYEETMQIFKVKHISAQELAKLLDDILKEKNGGSSRTARTTTSRLQSKSGSTGPSISKIIADPRTNSIIAMANASGAEHLKELMEKLDTPIASKGNGRIQVYYLQHGDSENLSKTLTTLVTNTRSGASRSNSNSSGSRLSSSTGLSEEPVFDQEVKITSDKSTNSLVVTCSPTDWLTVKDVIQKLDIPRSQVFVEGLILETNVSRENSFGISYVGAYGTANSERAGLNVKDSGIINLLGGDPTSLGGFFTGFGVGKERKVDFLVGGKKESVTVKDVNGLVKAIAARSNGNILATPQILATDNTEATFTSGETVPVRNSTVSNNQTNISTTKQEINLTLKITPQINKVTRFVKLNIDQKVEDFNESRAVSTEGGGAPTLVRAAKTEVIIKDRDTVAMGGLMRDKITDSTSKVPLLGDIPVLGWLFKNRTKQVAKVNMLFFLTPRILTPYEDTAGKLTKHLLTKRSLDLSKVNEDVDPHQDMINELTERATRQVGGQPGVIDQATIDLSKNDAPLDENVPNYSEIKDDIAGENL